MIRKRTQPDRVAIAARALKELNGLFGTLLHFELPREVVARRRVQRIDAQLGRLVKVLLKTEHAYDCGGRGGRGGEGEGREVQTAERIIGENRVRVSTPFSI